MTAKLRTNPTLVDLWSEIERLKEANRILLEESNTTKVSKRKELSVNCAKTYNRIKQDSKRPTFTEAQVDELKKEHKLRLAVAEELVREEQFRKEKIRANNRKVDWEKWAASPKLELKGVGSLVLETLVACKEPNCNPNLVTCALEIIRRTDPQNEILRY
jgi:hypothetical protein